jgi:hypothetical protein
VSVSSVFLDPRLFNFVIMTLYLCAAIRFAISKRWVDMLYWLGALLITGVVTFGYSEK